MRTTLDIQGMHCDACMGRLTDALGAVPGVTSARVTLLPPRAVVEAGRDVPIEEFASAARRAGEYTVSPSAGEESHVRHAADTSEGEPKPSLYPLALIIAFLAGAVVVGSLARGPWLWRPAMNDFMAGFFLVFSFFKLLDLRGFADAYQSYDVLARRSRAYAFAYPFLELSLGVAFLARWQPTVTNVATLALMLVSSIGVLRALLGKRRIRCACLGTALNLPMTTVTLVEDLGMAGMALAMLLAGP